MFHFILGGCGTGKSTELMHRIKADLENQKNVILLVPEQFSFEAEKKLYQFLGAKLFNQFKTYSFATLSRTILQNSGVHKNDYASEQGKLLFLYQAVQQCQQQKELQLLGKQNNSDFLTQLQVLITKIRKAGVSAEQLMQTAPAFSGKLGQKVQDISKILTAYDIILQNHGLCDNLTDLTESASVAIMHDFFQGKQIYIDEFDSFTGDQYQMLEVIAEQAETITAAIRSDATNATPSNVFLGGNHTYQQLKKLAPDANSVQIQECNYYRRSAHKDLQFVAERIPFGNGNAEFGEYQNHVHVFSAYDALGETEYICATICKILSKNKNLSCKDIAIAVKKPEIYMPLLERAMTRYHLPYDIAVKKSVLHTELITYFLSLLELLCASSWSTDAILRYLKNDFSGYDLETVSMLEHFCFTYSIDKQDWETSFYEQGNEVISNMEQFGGQILEDLRSELIYSLRNLRNQCHHMQVRTICRVLYQHLCSKNQAYQEIYQNLDVLQQHEFITLWNILSEILDTAVVTFGNEEMSLKALHDVFLLLLQNSSFSVPPQTLDSIRIVDAQTARLNMPAIVFVPGVSEGVFPSEIQESHMLRQHELELLEKQKIKLSRLFKELYSDELLIISKIFSAPSEQLYVTYPSVSAEHEFINASPVIGDILSLFPEDAGILQTQEKTEQDYYAWTMESAYFHFVRNLHQDTISLASLRAVLEQDIVYASKIRKLSETQKEQNIRISPEVIQKLIGRTLNVSASGIEKFYRCPFQYFCMYCLHLYAPEKVAFTARNIGNFAHHCLEEILKKYDMKSFSELSASQLQEEIKLLSETFSKENFSDAVRRDGRFQLNYRMNSQSLLQLLQHMQEELKKSKFTPVEVEKKIAPFPMRNGQILCHGKIDRVDICNTGQETLLRVIDYKTSEKEFLPERLADGIDLQMLIYLFILEENQAYGNTSPSAVLYMPSGQPKETSYGEREKKTKSNNVLNDYYRMKGLLLDSTLAYIEPELSEVQTSVMKKNKKGLFSVNSEQMRHLKQHVYQKIYDMADKIYAGELAPAPDLYGENFTPCQYCNYKDLCGEAEFEVCKREKEEIQQALEAVFGKDTKGEE